MNERDNLSIDAVYTSNVVQAPTLIIEEGKRVPFGWRAIPISNTELGNVTKLYCKAPQNKGDGFIRLTIAVDIREEHLIEVFLLKSQRVIGVFDIQYAYVFQMFEIKVSSKDIGAIMEEGIGLKMIKGEKPLWFFGENAEGKNNPPRSFLPHIFVPTDKQKAPIDEFYSQLFSLSSIQPFGWMEGCVLDGLMDLRSKFPTHKVRYAIEQHLAMFFDKQNNLVYENPRSEPVDGVIYGIEGTLPFAAIAQLWPEHPVLEQVIEFFISKRKKDGAISDGNTLTAEGSYTVAYPLAVLSKVKNDEVLADMAIEQLLICKEMLIREETVVLRSFEDGRYTFKNWARAFAWYMIGLTRSLEFLKETPRNAEKIKALKEECRRVAVLAISHQHPTGLWHCFVDEPNVAFDTSGSAGIAAALAKGWQLGILSDEAGVAAKKTFDALQEYLTPDGFLGGVAQSNRNGEGFQRSDYRVLSQMGMGLMAQLGSIL